MQSHPAWGYKSAPLGGVLPTPGNTAHNDLRTSRTGWMPVLSRDKCIDCGVCDMVCPDLCLVWSTHVDADGKPGVTLDGVDYQYCKGCMRCVETCSTGAMTREAELPGMADELRLGDNMRGYLAVASLHELDQIVRAMGGRSGSPFHLAGLGDLIATATSDESHHHELGRMLARGETAGIAGEGVHTLAMVSRHRLLPEAHYPLFHLVHEMVSDPRDARTRIDAFLQRRYAAPFQ